MSEQTDLLAAIRAGMAPTWLDRTISRWAPGWGVRRLQDRITLAAVGGYAWSGARRDLPTLQNFNPVNQSPEDEQRWDREFLVARSTALERDDALAGGAVAEMVTSVVGTGRDPSGLQPR